MTLAATRLAFVASETDATSYETASVTPAVDSVVVVAVVASNTGATPPDIGAGAVSGNCVDQVIKATGAGGGNATYDTLATPRKRITLFTARGTGVAGALTVSFGATQHGCHVCVIEVTGASHGAVVFTNPVHHYNGITGRADATAAVDLDLGVKDGPHDSLVIAAVGSDAGGTNFVPDDTWAALHQIGHNNPGSRIAVLWKASYDGTFGGDFALARDWGGVGVEIGHAVTGVAAGAATSSGSATGTRIVAGTAAGAATSSGGATGTRAVVGAAAGAATSSGSASGTRSVLGAAAGAASSSGTAAGTRVVFGAASGSASTSGAATGTRVVLGTAAGTATSSGTATGTSTPGEPEPEPCVTYPGVVVPVVVLEVLVPTVPALDIAEPDVKVDVEVCV